MSCANWRDLCLRYRIESPSELRKAIKIAFENVQDGTLHETVPLEQAMPQAYAELMAVRATLEKHYKDMQDIEFTVQQNKLYMLQTRNGKSTAAAADLHIKWRRV